MECSTSCICCAVLLSNSFNLMSTYLMIINFFFTGCELINITCSEIREASGFNFTYGCPLQSFLEVEDSNKTSIASYGSANNTSDTLPEVVTINENSIVTKSCRDLKVKCFIYENFLEEKSVCFKVIDHLIPSSEPKPENYDSSSDPKRKDIFIIGAIIVIGVSFAALVGWFVCWKKKQKKQQKSEAVAAFFKYVATCSCFPKADSPEARTQTGSGFQLVTTREVENQVRNGSIFSQSAENDPLEIVSSGDTKAPDITSHSHHRPMNRNLRDDPGGENGTETRNLIREGDSGQTARKENTEDSVTERQQLLSDRRAVDTGLDMTGGAEALVNKAGFDHVSRCSGALIIDVESENKEEPK
ncbi:uncharacterized protein LOC106527138 [Austrofundulus limnaeus]|uniref:Uncharacterized protein LOC106527138 n=1 Tax=Austrofundulus limnaeus TaxID=52670 RepID=A0A2I4CBM0_AUSLI|nr:PREDICTED: uncharacterized protein LOC106527138 [Austrofundulus limnaeus]